MSVQCHEPTFRRTGVMECRPVEAASLRLDIGCADQLPPIFGFTHDELAEVSRRTHKHSGPHVGKPCPNLRIDQTRVDLVVELVNDRGGRIPGRTDATKITSL